MDTPPGLCWFCRQTALKACPSCKMGLYCSENCMEKDEIRHKVECINAKRLKRCSQCQKKFQYLMPCHKCGFVYYCNQKCQQLHSLQHKVFCNNAVSKVVEEAQNRKSIPPVSHLEFSGFIGTTPSHNYLQLSRNEGDDYKDDLYLLFVGVGDMRSVVQTTAETPKNFQGRLHFVLNDLSVHISARNLLLLYMSIANPQPEKIVQIWYSRLLIPETHAYLVNSLSSMLSAPRETVLNEMKNTVNITDEHWNECCELWAGWLAYSNDHDVAENMELLFQANRQNNPIPEDVARIVPELHASSVRDWFKNGLLLPLNSSERQNAVLFNTSMLCFNAATMQGKFPDAEFLCPALQNIAEGLSIQDDMIFGVEVGACVFRCWDYIEVKSVVSPQIDLLEMYHDFLNIVISNFCNQVSSGNVSFKFITDSFRHIRYHLETDIRFDRISVGHLSDYYGIPTLLQEFGRMLNYNNPHATLLSHHMIWYTFSGLVDGFSPEAVKAGDRARAMAALDLPNRIEILPDLRIPKFYYDYLDIWPFFFRSLQAETLLYINDQEGVSLCADNIRHPQQLARKFKLRYRDYHRELNRIIPCRFQTNSRRSSMNNGICITLEWNLMKDE